MKLTNKVVYLVWSDVDVARSVADHMLEVQSGAFIKRLGFDGEMRVTVNLKLVEAATQTTCTNALC